MNRITLLGLTAGALTTISLLPQVIKIWKSKSAKDISLGMYSILCSGLLLWIFYGFFIDSAPVVITNILSFILACVIMALKMRYG
jgi:MtN3 and saliva related transmembrane protein